MITLTAGAAASRDWLIARGLAREPLHWFVEISIPSDASDTRLELNIYPEEWGFVFRRGARVSSIRVTDIAFAHGRDDYELLGLPASLESIGELLHELEQRFAIEFAVTRSVIRTNINKAANVVRTWLAGSS